MSKDKNNINIALINTPEVPEELSQTIADTFNDTTTPVRQQIGFALGDIAYMAFGALNHHANKKKINRSIDLKSHEQKQQALYQQNLKHFLSETSDSIKSIPDDKLCEPRLDIVGPALEASKYYISNEEIRNMFTKLIAASMNIDTSQQVHHSYVEVIKQLSPLDAANLKILSKKNLYPMAQYKLTKEPSNTSLSYAVLKDHVWVYNPNCDDLQLNAVSISNLHRLGLVNAEYATFINDFDYDALFKNQPSFKKYSEIMNNIKEGIPMTNLPDDAHLLFAFPHLVIQKGTASLTPMGKSFVSICL